MRYADGALSATAMPSFWFGRSGRRAVFMVTCLGALACCGGPSRPVKPPPNVQEKILPPDATPPPSTITTSREEAPTFHPTSGPGDAPTAFVRDERSSRLDTKSPHGRAHASWTQPLGTRREVCRGCSPEKATFILAAGDRVAVAGSGEWVLFDTEGHRVDGGKIEGPSVVRLDRVGGSVVPDETRAPDLPVGAKVAAHHGLVVMVKDGGVYVGERSIEGKFEAYDVAIDDAGNACVVVRQGEDLVVWTVPTDNKGSIGRQKIPGRHRRILAPPVLGKHLRVFVLDGGVLALNPEGKRVWERKGAPTGGISITTDDHVLIADNGTISVVDPKGKTTELWSDRDAVYVSAPILNATGMLFVASTETLHALAF